jgi:hypothetical protein
MPEQAIVHYTEEVAREIAQRMAGDALGELRIWVRLAHQREAMVSQLYQLSGVDQRLRGADPGGPAPVMRSAMASIWAHEESHTRFLAAIRSFSESAPGLVELQGQLEGRITRAAVSGGLLARALIAIGASLGRVPEFATELGRLDLRQLVEFHGELESTARMGYQRILELLRALGNDQEARRDFGFTFLQDVARILAEERFHEDAFGAMAGWVNAGGDGLAAMEPARCTELLYDLAERNLSMGVVQRIVDPNAAVTKDAGPDVPWVSDGGLGELFRQHGLTVRLAQP